MTPWTVALQAPLSMEFSKEEYWSGLPFPSSGDLPDPGIEPWSPALPADSLPSESPGKPNPILRYYYCCCRSNVWGFFLPLDMLSVNSCTPLMYLPYFVF